MSALFALCLIGQYRAKPLPFPPARPELYRPTPGGPRLAEVTGICELEGGHSNVVLPVPIDYTGQKTVALTLACEPTSRLESWTCEDTRLNRDLRVTLTGTGKAKLTWRAWVLAPQETAVRVQDKDFAEWRQASSLVPITTAVRKRATRFQGDDFYVGAMRWVAENRPQSTTGKTVAEALAKGGSSFGRALLLASLMRAKGVGARVVQYVSAAGAFAGPGWITEVETDEGRWQETEPTIGLSDPERNSFVVMHIALPSDEVAASGSAWPWAPRGSAPWATESAVEFRNYTVSSVLLKAFPGPANGRIMSSAYDRAALVKSAAAKGRSMAFDEAKLAAALKGGVMPFCNLLDGR